MGDETVSNAQMSWAPPTAEMLARVGTECSAMRVEWAQRLLGGTHALTDVLLLDGAQVVLRRFPDTDDAVAREAAVLDHLEAMGDLVPRLLAADVDGSSAGQPVVLTTRLAGRATLEHRDAGDAAVQLGAALARLHSCSRPESLPDLLRPPRPTLETVTALSGGWERARRAPRVLTHQDFWTGNTLWSDEELTGVVDWSGAGSAPGGFDVAWARLDLVLLHGQERADALVHGYLDAGGQPVEDLAWWDLYAATNAATSIEGWAPNYQGLGREDLDGPELRARLGSWLQTLTS